VFREKAAIFYRHVRGYGVNAGAMGRAFGISFFLQTMSLFIQYLVVHSFPADSGIARATPGIFFIYIPMVWLASLVPSLGGFGVREYSYLYFFGPLIGTGAAGALMLVNFLLIILQGVAGGVIFLFYRNPHQQ
jgi:hypothetical protein